MSGLVKVAFHGDELLAHQDERGVWVVVKRVCEAMGLTEQRQMEKLKGKPWAVTTMMVATGSDGKSYEMMALHLDALPMWLATIDAGRVAPAVRAKIERYQVEAARVLRDHFFGGPAPTPAPQLAGEPAWAQDLRAQIAVMQTKLTLLTGRIDDPEHDGQIGPERAACIRRQLAVYGQLMGHGDAWAAKSWRKKGDDELRLRMEHPRSKGHSWDRLPVARYGKVLATLEEMLARARKADVAHLEASQLPLKTG